MIHFIYLNLIKKQFLFKLKLLLFKYFYKYNKILIIKNGKNN